MVELKDFGKSEIITAGEINGLKVVIESGFNPVPHDTLFLDINYEGGIYENSNEILKLLGVSNPYDEIKSQLAEDKPYVFLQNVPCNRYDNPIDLVFSKSYAENRNSTHKNGNIALFEIMQKSRKSKFWYPIFGPKLNSEVFINNFIDTLVKISNINASKTIDNKQPSVTIALSMAIWDHNSEEIIGLFNKAVKKSWIKELISKAKNQKIWWVPRTDEIANNINNQSIETVPSLLAKYIAEETIDFNQSFSESFKNSRNQEQNKINSGDIFIIGGITHSNQSGEEFIYIIELFKEQNKNKSENFFNSETLKIIKKEKLSGALKRIEGKSKGPRNNFGIIHITIEVFEELISYTEYIDLIPADPEKKSVQTPPPKNENVPAYTDNPEVEDRLGREPIAKSVVAVIKKIWQDAKKASVEYGYSFMIHIHGPWGSGKSTFLNLIEKELKQDDWVVIKFNAWQHQHIEQPWWSLLNIIYKKAKLQTSYWKRIKLIFFETLRRLVSGNRHKMFFALIFFVITILLGFKFLPGIIKSDPGTPLDILKASGLIITTLLTIFSFSKSISGSLFFGSNESAHDFLKHSINPMHRLKKHFGKLIKSIKKPVAIFIDDLDRCEPEYVVKLIEGIQTLFRETQVLYIVAADRLWIAKCFEIHYKDFDNENITVGTRLGYLFTQKAFQLSVRLPMLHHSKIGDYWKYLLNVEPSQKISQEVENLKLKFKGTNTENEVKERVNDLHKNENVPTQVARAAAVEVLNQQEYIEATEHELQQYAIYLEPNPRAIKRTANFYNILNRTLFLEGRDMNTSVKVRWLVLSQRWPILAEALEKSQS